MLQNIAVFWEKLKRVRKGSLSAKHVFAVGFGEDTPEYDLSLNCFLHSLLMIANGTLNRTLMLLRVIVLDPAYNLVKFSWFLSKPQTATHL